MKYFNTKYLSKYFAYLYEAKKIKVGDFKFSLKLAAPKKMALPWKRNGL